MNAPAPRHPRRLAVDPAAAPRSPVPGWLLNLLLAAGLIVVSLAVGAIAAACYQLASWAWGG